MLRLKDLREDKDLKQKDISKLINTSREQYCRYENEDRYIPIKHLKTLCEFYNTSADYILGLTNDINPYIKANNEIRLKSLRKANKKTQQYIADALKTTQEQYSKYENNIVSMPVYHIITLANLYNVSVDYVIGITNETKYHKRVS